MRKVYLVGTKEVKFTGTGGEEEKVELLGYSDGSLEVFSSIKKAVDECRKIRRIYIEDGEWLDLSEFPEKPGLGVWYPVAYTGRYRAYLQVKLGLVE